MMPQTIILSLGNNYTPTRFHGGCNCVKLSYLGLEKGDNDKDYSISSRLLTEMALSFFSHSALFAVRFGSVIQSTV